MAVLDDLGSVRGDTASSATLNSDTLAIPDRYEVNEPEQILPSVGVRVEELGYASEILALPHHLHRPLTGLDFAHIAFLVVKLKKPASAFTLAG